MITFTFEWSCGKWSMKNETLKSEFEEIAEIEWDPSLVLLYCSFILNTFLKLILSPAEILLHSNKYPPKSCQKFRKGLNKLKLFSCTTRCICIMPSLRAQGHHLLPSCSLMVLATKRYISRKNRRHNDIKHNVFSVLKFWNKRGWDQAETIGRAEQDVPKTRNSNSES